MTRLPNLERLQTFLVVAQTLSFRAAAQKLFIAQPAVSRAVKALEEELGLVLLTRTTRQVSLTAAGALLAEKASLAFDQLHLAVRSARQAATGEAGTLVASYSALSTHSRMSEIVVRFKEKCPQVRVSTYLMSSEEQLMALKRGEIDLGFMLSVACSDPERHIIIDREQFMLVLPRSHALASASGVHLADLAGESWVVGSISRWRSFRALLEGACVKTGFLPKIVDEGDDIPVLLRLVSMGMGITVLGSSLRGALPANLAGIPIVDAHATFAISLVWEDYLAGSLAGNFIEFTKAWLASPPT